MSKRFAAEESIFSHDLRLRAGTFSVGCLMEFLTALGHDAEVTVRPTGKEHGEMSVNLG